MYITIIAAISTDGFIAGPDGDMEWLSPEDAKVLKQTIKDNDVLIMGSGTFMAQRHMFKVNSSKTRIVLTRDPKKYTAYSHLANFTSAMLQDIALSYASSSKKLLILGGSHLYTECLTQKIGNKILLTVEPTVLGNGTPFLQSNLSLHEFTKNLHLQDQRILNTEGTKLLTYSYE